VEILKYILWVSGGRKIVTRHGFLSFVLLYGIPGCRGMHELLKTNTL
jgi:hypothetical protein